MGWPRLSSGELWERQCRKEQEGGHEQDGATIWPDSLAPNDPVWPEIGSDRSQPGSCSTNRCENAMDLDCSKKWQAVINKGLSIREKTFSSCLWLKQTKALEQNKNQKISFKQFLHNSGLDVRQFVWEN